MCVCVWCRKRDRARVCVLPAKINRWWDYVYAYTHRSNRGRLHTRRACWSFRKGPRPISLPACAAIAACSLSATDVGDVSCLNRILMRRLYNMCIHGPAASIPTAVSQVRRQCLKIFPQTLRYHFREKEKKNVDRACYF